MELARKLEELYSKIHNTIREILAPAVKEVEGALGRASPNVRLILEGIRRTYEDITGTLAHITRVNNVAVLRNYVIQLYGQAMYLKGLVEAFNALPKEVSGVTLLLPVTVSSSLRDILRTFSSLGVM